MSSRQGEFEAPPIAPAQMAHPLSILVIRRDNIGDLVCTTPLLGAIRATYPDAWIGVLANSYNAAVLEGHPDVDAVFAYHKRKHGEIGLIASLRERLRLIRQLWARRLDWVVIATPAFQPRFIRLARWLRPRQVAAYVPAEAPAAVTRPLAAALPLRDMEGQTEVELVFRFAPVLGLRDAVPPPLKVVAAADAVKAMQDRIGAARGRPTIGVHISARKPSQRWPAERFAETMRELHRLEDARFVLFWAPGPAGDPRHPGDDEKAAALVSMCAALPLIPLRTNSLRDLIAGIAACDTLILGDGGAMHVAAALGKPLVCLFGQSDAARWRPWGTACRVLQHPSREVAAITVDEVVSAYNSLGENTDGGDSMLLGSMTLGSMSLGSMSLTSTPLGPTFAPVEEDRPPR